MTYYTEFAIDDTPFRPSNALPVQYIEAISRWRSINQTLNVQKWDYERKREYVFDFKILSEKEFETLSFYINSGFHTVTSNIEGAVFHFDAFLELLEYDEGFAGTKLNVKVKVLEK